MAEFSFQNATLKMVIIGEDGIARTAFLREADDQIVTGPSSAVSGHLAVFADTSGQTLEDGGAVPAGGGGGLAEWDSETEYSAGTIVVDRGGIWKATGTNDDSRPVSGNTDWELVGGTPYIDVVVTPPEQIVPPFFQEGGVPGEDGVVLVPAPGAGKFVQWVGISSQSGDGFQFTDPGAHVFYQGVTPDPDYTVNALDTVDNFSFIPVVEQILIMPSVVEDLAILIATSNATASDGTAASILYRVWYEIRDVVPSQFSAAGNFYSITAIDQTNKAITVSDTGTLGGATGATSIVGSTDNDGDYTIVAAAFMDENSSEAITAVNDAAKKFTIAGNHAASYLLGMQILVIGSTGNDGLYTVVSATFVTDHTDIVVSEVVPDNTADGNISYAENNKTYVLVSEAIPDSTADGWVKQ